MSARVIGRCQTCAHDVGTRMARGSRVAYPHFYYGNDQKIAVRGERCPGSGRPTIAHIRVKL
jgi:hypothetical protein